MELLLASHAYQNERKWGHGNLVSYSFRGWRMNIHWHKTPSILADPVISINENQSLITINIINSNQ